MEQLNVKPGVLEVKEFTLDDIIRKISMEDTSAYAPWFTKELFIHLWEANPRQKKQKELYLLWLLNNDVVGFSYLQKAGDTDAIISFKIKEGKELTPESLEDFLETSIDKSFEISHLEKILFDCGENCSTGVSKAFINYFQPYPIGWVHLNDGKYVLTRGQIDQKAEEFYKM